MYEPFHKLKFYGAASYVDQVRAGINYFVKKKGKKAVCAMYQDTDFGKEVLDGVQSAGREDEAQDRRDGDPQADRPGLHRARSPSCKAAGCDLVVLGTIVRDSIVPYATARKIGLERRRLPRLGRRPTTSSSAAAQGGVTRASTPWASPTCPTRHAVAAVHRSGSSATRSSYKVDPNIGAVYGYVAADLTVPGPEERRHGPDRSTASSRGWSRSRATRTSSTARGQLRPEHAPGRQLVVPGRGEGRALGPRDRAAELLIA